MEKTASLNLQVLGVLLMVIVRFKSADGNGYYAHCGTRPTVVRVDEPQYRYYPFYVTLNRCDGSCSTHPGNQLCKPTAEEEVRVQVFDMEKNAPVDLIMTNHTKCKCGCVASFDSCRLELESWEPINCRCKCRYPDGPPKDFACKEGFRWRRDACRCQCNKAPEVCPPNKIWSTDACGCVCTTRVIKRCQRKGKGLDEEKCECVDIQALLKRNPKQENPNSRIFITLLVGQGFLLIVIICVLIYYIRKSKKKTPPAEHEEQPNSPRPDQSPSDSGNISINSSQGTPDQGFTSEAPMHFKTSNGSINFWNGTAKETVI